MPLFAVRSASVKLLGERIGGDLARLDQPLPAAAHLRHQHAGAAGSAFRIQRFKNGQLHQATFST